MLQVAEGVADISVTPRKESLVSIESTRPHAPEVDPLDEMKQLLGNAERFTSTVQRELDELVTSRDELLAAVQRESAEIRAEALQAAEAMVSDAEARATRLLAETDAQAEELLRETRAERDRLGKVNVEYRAALATLREAARAVDGVSEGLDASPNGEARTVGESTEVGPVGTEPHETVPSEPAVLGLEATDAVAF